mgnify:FL=1
MRMARGVTLAGAAIGALIMAACAPATIVGPNTTVTASPDSVERSAAPTPPPDPRPAVIWPLTGLDATTVSDSELSRPALSVKIENTDAARPQSNLEFADIVFEENVEYGISRLIAVYHSEYPESVGPIRSMRPMDRNIMGSLGGPLVFSGAQRRFINQAAASGITLIAQDVGSGGFFRTKDKRAPHNLHGYLKRFQEQSEGAKAPSEQWEFAYPETMATATLSGKATASIDIRFSSYAHPHWDWDASVGLWKRFEGKTPHKVMSGKQITATNIVIMWVTVQETGATNQGMSVPETMVAGKSGKGWVATGGKRIAITWSKKGQFDTFVFKDASGEEVALAPGQTWLELVPTNGGHRTEVTFK